VLERTNRLIRLFGESQKRAMRAEKRTEMRSALFDLPRRSSLGWRCLHDNQDRFLRRLADCIAPEELGRRMRVVGGRPYALQPFIIVCSYLGHRQQRMLDLGLEPGMPFPEEKPEELSFLMDFWARMQHGYRSDDVLLPGEADDSLPILDEGTIAELRRLAGDPDRARFETIRRMTATLELYNFILHGEQRDGIFGHGPYRLDGSRSMFLREFNDLRNEYLPWAGTETRNPHPNVAIVYVAHDVSVRCDMFGSATVDPHDLDGRLDAVAVLTNEGGRLRSLSDEEIGAVQVAAAIAQQELYMKAAGWDEIYKIAYGGPLFANHVKPFFDIAEMPGAEAAAVELMEACVKTADSHAAELARAEVPSVWGYIAATDSDMYWPMVA
jgi:hypothetical protein